MRKAGRRTQEPNDDMAPEYDFSKLKGAVRGKYQKAYQQGHEVRILREDGTTAVHWYGLEDGAVMLEPDVREYFRDSEAVNRALRGLIAIAPHRKAASHPKS